MVFHWKRLFQRSVWGFLVGSAFCTQAVQASDANYFPLYDGDSEASNPPAVIVEPEYSSVMDEDIEHAMPAEFGGEWFECPTWTMQVGAVVLRRESANSFPFTNGTTPINVGDMGFDYQTGITASAIRHGLFCSCWDLQLSYFGVNNFDSTATSTNVTTINSTPAINAAPMNVTTRYTSRLDNSEINFRRSTDGTFTILGGFRWIELAENLDTDMVIANHGVNTNNHLYGLQVGAEAPLLDCGAFVLYTFGKVGIFYNAADQNTTTVNVGGALPSIFARDNRTAFVGDVGIMGSYAINRCWFVRGGYQVLFIDGVALASDQVASTNIATGVAALEAGNTAIYHGFVATIEKTW